MTDTLITDVQQGIIDQLDSTALNAIIWDYLNNPDNGFMDSEQVVVVTDATTCTLSYPEIPDDATSAIDTTAECIFIDTTTVTSIDTTSLWTVEEWKDVYYELTFNDAMKTIEKIGFLDSNSPNNPLTGYEDILFNFDTSESLDYPMSPDTTGDIYIEYRYPTAQKIDGVFFQGGDDGAQFYDTTSSDTTAELVILAGYVSYSKNGTDWDYLKNQTQWQTGSTVAIAATDAADAESSPFIFRETYGFDEEKVANIAFNATALEAQFWRFHIVDLTDYLEYTGETEGYTGYTAAVSHLRFQQLKLNGEFIITQTMPGDAIVPGGIGGEQIGNKEIEERHLADFSIGNIKLADGVAGVLDISRSTDFTAIGSGTWATMGSTFALGADDGYSRISVMFQCDSPEVLTTGVNTDDYWRLQYLNDSNVWTTIEASFAYPYMQWGAPLQKHYLQIHQTLVFTEGYRSNYSRIFRVQAYYGTSTWSKTINIRALAVYAQ